MQPMPSPSLSRNPENPFKPVNRANAWFIMLAQLVKLSYLTRIVIVSKVLDFKINSEV